VAIRPTIEADRKTVSVSGYATPGVLQDCTPFAPNDDYQLEFNNFGIVEIAYSLGIPFGVQAIGGLGANDAAIFKRVAIEPNERVMPFLAGLARQRNLIISNDPSGELLFYQESPVPSSPESVFGPSGLGQLVATLEEGFQPLLNVSPSFREQEYYSHITALQPYLIGLRVRQYTVKNERLPTITRPYTFYSNDSTNIAEVQEAAEAKAGYMFANAVEYSVEVNTWRTSSGQLWKV
jgi:prophage tail gpP-like protein